MKMRMSAAALTAAMLSVFLFGGGAHAALIVSTGATSNVTCSSGVCTATAQNAVLNVRDLERSLAHGDTTLASGSTAQDIEFDTPAHWTSAQRLTLDSYHAITFTQPVTSEGTGGLTIETDDGGTGGDFYFSGKGRVAFWDTSSSLIINGNSYALVSNVAALAAGIAANSSGRFAFANNYNASVDGAYSQSPVSTEFTGTFEGLGNSISHLTINGCCGLFDTVGDTDANGTLRDVILFNETVKASSGDVGGLVGTTYGNVIGASTIGGSVMFTGEFSAVGGLIGFLDSDIGSTHVGTAIRSHSSARVSCRDRCSVGGLVGAMELSASVKQSSASGAVHAGNNANAGGLVGGDEYYLAAITLSFATGSVSVGNAMDGKNGNLTATAGGLIGYNGGLINESYATGAVSGGSGMRIATNHVSIGGLVGWADSNGTGAKSSIRRSYARGAAAVGDQGYVGGLAGTGPVRFTPQCYSTGMVSVTAGTSEIGGFVGHDTSSGFETAFDYWDMDTSGVSDPSKGAGNAPNDPGITGLTTAQLQSGLPTGFDSTVWIESSGINNGLPYLQSLPPSQ